MATTSTSVPKNWTEWASANLPDWLIGQGPLAALVGLALVLPTDVTFLAMSEAIIQRCQQDPDSPDDVLSILGQEANLPQYASESYDAFRLRLSDKWNIWEKAGTDATILSELALVGFPNSKIIYDLPGGGLYSDIPAQYQIPSYPNSNQWWSQFIVVINLSSPVGSGAEGRSVLISDPQLQEIRSVVSKWKDSQFVCREIVVEWNPGGDRYDTGLQYDVGHTYDANATGTVEHFNS